MKTFLITGATSGIGEACARHCLAQGDQVVALCRNGDKAHRLFAPELASGQMVLLEHDLACNDGLYKQCLSELKPFKIERFIHCAGVGLIKGMASTTHAELLQLYETHLFALSEIMRALVRLCQFKYELSAVALSSVASPAYLVQNAAYGLSKDKSVCLLQRRRWQPLRPSMIPSSVLVPWRLLRLKQDLCCVSML